MSSIKRFVKQGGEIQTGENIEKTEICSMLRLLGLTLSTFWAVSEVAMWFSPLLLGSDQGGTFILLFPTIDLLLLVQF